MDWQVTSVSNAAAMVPSSHLACCSNSWHSCTCMDADGSSPHVDLTLCCGTLVTHCLLCVGALAGSGTNTSRSSALAVSNGVPNLGAPTHHCYVPHCLPRHPFQSGNVAQGMLDRFRLQADSRVQHRDPPKPVDALQGSRTGYELSMLTWTRVGMQVYTNTQTHHYTQNLELHHLA